MAFADTPSYKTRRGGMTALGGVVQKASKTALSKRGFAEARLITDWPRIVGEVLGAESNPIKLSFRGEQRREGVLHVEVYDSGMATQMAHLEPLIQEKIALYFGYRAVGKLRLLHKPGGRPNTQAKKPQKVKPPVPEAIREEVQQMTDSIVDEGLKAVLESLGGAIWQKNKGS